MASFGVSCFLDITLWMKKAQFQKLEQILGRCMGLKTHGETFNSFLLGYIPKGKAFSKQKFARMSSAFNDWNDNHGCPVFHNWRRNTMQEEGIVKFS